MVTLEELQRSNAQVGESVDSITILHFLKSLRTENIVKYGVGDFHGVKFMGRWMELNSGQSRKKDHKGCKGRETGPESERYDWIGSLNINARNISCKKTLKPCIIFLLLHNYALLCVGFSHNLKFQNTLKLKS
ncbi:hypothetical protein ATANTOWER_004360 [Ataeniobius toweri]|uniref:Uncharacterized protein n=1 Tax=Ataeniobius toweri TaxID=208326 RepID=A0ABU7B4S4_9TELE|nr:hypothetical protein [Ataeniobius toweri]